MYSPLSEKYLTLKTFFVLFFFSACNSTHFILTHACLCWCSESSFHWNCIPQVLTGNLTIHTISTLIAFDKPSCCQKNTKSLEKDDFLRGSDNRSESRSRDQTCISGEIPAGNLVVYGVVVRTMCVCLSKIMELAMRVTENRLGCMNKAL